MNLNELSDLELKQQNSILSYQTVIKVLGAGGAGNNTVHNIFKSKMKNISSIAVNTDGQDLLAVQADERILIGRNLTSGLGAGGDPVIGERSAEESRESILKVIEGTDLLFLTCGMGGGTGTGSLPAIGKMAKDLGILTIAIVTMPFSEEGVIRWENSQVGLDKLRNVVDTVIVLRNDKLIHEFPDLPFREAFKKCDEILFNALNGLTSLILSRGLINLDFADISMILRDGPTGLIGLGESNTEKRAEEAAMRAIQHPMMDSSIAGAQSALIHVSGGMDMTLKEAREIVRIVSKSVDQYARIIWGVTVDKTLKQSIKVMMIFTGLPEAHLPKRLQTDQDESILTKPAQSSAEEEVVDTEITETGQNIFDIKESILASGNEISLETKTSKPVTQASKLFYTLFEEEAAGDLNRFERAVKILKNTPDNKRAVIDARQACKLLLASAQMFGFDEIAQVLRSVDDILACLQSMELKLDDTMLDSISLAMEMVNELIQNRSDGRGESGHLVDRLQELRNEKMDSAKPS